MSGVSAMQRVVLHFNPVEEHASLKESQRAEEEMRNGDLAIHHPVQVCIEVFIALLMFRKQS